tara:strand:+ start:13318 stop:13479 length:162 start_codon:yes stop_codon:yes gene_type:complete
VSKWQETLPAYGIVATCVPNYQPQIITIKKKLVTSHKMMIVATAKRNIGKTPG